MGKGLKYEKYQKEWKELYESEMSFRKIGQLYKVDAKTVNRTLEGLVEICPKSPWDKYVDEWYELYKDGYSKTDISRKYKCDIGIVTRVLEKKGVKRKTGGQKKLYEHLASDFAELYKDGYSTAEIGNMFNIDSQTILNYLNDLDVEIRDLSEAIRKYEINEHYFDTIDNAKKAYHLGVLFATGSALKLHNSYCIQITMHISKKDIIKPLVYVLRSGEDIGGYVGADNVIRYRFHSRHLNETLIKHGLDAKNKITLPDLEEQWYPAFLAGYMSDKSYISKSNNHLHISGSKALLTSFKGFLSKIIGVDKIHIYDIRENEHVFAITNQEAIDCLNE
ncbi:hypothetical protein [Bacillus sp. NPDC057893]|uniref:hypothetical protein n=1 Tax=Bacillus sp. NPDC057893 TaxID=3346273 RepID=UPI00366BCDB2